MRICITGGCGYVGTPLAEMFMSRDNIVTVYDNLWFGCHFRNSEMLRVIQGDIRDLEKFKEAVKGQDVVIHLACIANDPSVELDAEETKTINYDCFEPLVLAAKAAKVKRFIYCSTSSVYGVSNSPHVTEDHPLVPVTLYNKYKGMCEPLLFKHKADNFTCTILRPATVCGYSPRQRLDLCVNILTNHAVNKKKITVFGGEQMRPNIHIEDLIRAYKCLVSAPHEKVHGEIFNVQCEYHSISDLAKMVKFVVEEQLWGGKDVVEIVTTPSDDPRSYRVNADKIKRVLGFEPSWEIEDAVTDLIQAFQNHLLPDSLTNPNYFNVERMKQLGMGTTPRWPKPAGVEI